MLLLGDKSGIVLRFVLAVTMVGVAMAQQHSTEVQQKQSKPQRVSPRVSQGLLCGSLSEGEPKQAPAESRRSSLCGGPVHAPMYPLEARRQRIQGTVLLNVTINKQGRVEDVRVLEGHPLLVPAAVEAVKGWRYKPYYVKGKPIPIETNVTVNFTLKSD